MTIYAGLNARLGTLESRDSQGRAAQEIEMGEELMAGGTMLPHDPQSLDALAQRGGERTANLFVAIIRDAQARGIDPVSHFYAALDELDAEMPSVAFALRAGLMAAVADAAVADPGEAGEPALCVCGHGYTGHTTEH